MNAMLAHEIKNPLAAIRGAAQLLGGTGAEMARLIIAESDRISDLIDKMQLFTSLAEMGDRACNVHTVLGEVLDGIAASVGQGHRLVPDYDPSLPMVQGNGKVLHRVFTNLIKNACEACGQSGGIQIKTRYALSEQRPIFKRGAKIIYLPLSPPHCPFPSALLIMARACQRNWAIPFSTPLLRPRPRAAAALRAGAVWAWPMWRRRWRIWAGLLN